VCIYIPGAQMTLLLIGSWNFFWWQNKGQMGSRYIHMLRTYVNIKDIHSHIYNIYAYSSYFEKITQVHWALCI